MQVHVQFKWNVEYSHIHTLVVAHGCCKGTTAMHRPDTPHIVPVYMDLVAYSEVSNKFTCKGYINKCSARFCRCTVVLFPSVLINTFHCIIEMIQPFAYLHTEHVHWQNHDSLVLMDVGHTLHVQTQSVTGAY